MTKTPRPNATRTKLLKATCNHARSIELLDGTRVCTACTAVLRVAA